MKCRIAPMLACLAGWLPAALAQEYQPYPAPRVTAGQWKDYLRVVRTHHGETAEHFKDEHLVAFADPATRTFYVFTTRKHAAHPAWITRQLVEQDGQVQVRQIGYFAGEEEPFAALFSQFLQKNEQLKKDAERRNR